MQFLTVGEFNFLIFLIPGFVTVWSFRYFSNINRKGDFEFLGLSFIWGMIILSVFGLIVQEEYRVAKLLSNPYAAAITLSLLGLILGWFGSKITRLKAFIKIVSFLKSDF
jgi:predicted membrane protein